MGEDLYRNEPKLKESGFCFDNCTRNLTMEKLGYKGPRATSTGTTLAACIFKGGVVMGGDTRATAGNIISDKDCVKVHKLTDSIYACGAGTAADLDQTAKMLASHLTLLELNTGRKAPVIAALRKAKQYLFRYMGYVGAYLLVGGVDFYGPHLYTIHAHGSSDNVPYNAEGSGSYAAMTILEMGYKKDMTEQEAEELVSQAIQAGMHADNGSGNAYRLVVIGQDGATYKGPIKPEFAMKQQPNDLEYRFKPGTTKVLKQKEIKFDIIEEMDVDEA